MSAWEVHMSCEGEEPQLWAQVAIEDDRDAFKCILSLLLDLRSRYEAPQVFVNGNRFVPSDEHVADYEAYTEALVNGEVPEALSLPLTCMKPYVKDSEQYEEEMRAREERRYEPPPPPPVRRNRGRKVKVKGAR